MLKSNRLNLLIMMALSVFLLQSGLLAQEVNENFQNLPIDPQTGIFLATFTATPTVSLVDGVLGLSESEPDDYGDYSCKILFNNEGFITASDGASFDAAAEVPYSGGTAYACKLLVNVLDQTYSVWVTPAGGDEVAIGENYAFAPSAGVVDSINWRSVKMSFGAPWGGAEGTVTVADFSIGLPDEMNVSTAFEPQDGKFMVNFDAYPTVSAVDGVIGFSKAVPSGWSEPVKVLFNNGGKFVARNGSSYEALNDFSYSGGMSYHLRMVIDIPQQSYDVWITPEGGAEVEIGKDYAFDGAADTLQWRTVIMSFDPQWGGAEGMVEITNFMISGPPMKKVAFVSRGGGEGWPADTILIKHLQEKFDLTIINDNDFYDSTMTPDSLQMFDFAFFSESVRTWTLEYGPLTKVKDIPIPMVLTEGYMSKSIILGWTTAGTDTGYGTIIDSLAAGGNKALIIDDLGHPLSAGFDYGAEVEILTQASSADQALTFTVPEIDHIPIAVSYLQPERTVVMGVEEGTTVWNDDGTVLEESDSTVTKNRAALIGIHANANAYITSDGFKLIDAAIAWIMHEEVANAIEDNAPATVPSGFKLDQNYPNPFNPSTEIAFTLSKTGHVTLTVYNVLGQKVATLIDHRMVEGRHQITFNTQDFNLASGVYFYQIRSNDFTAIRKMVLMK